MTFQVENQCDIAPEPAVVISGLNTGPTEFELNEFANVSAGLK